MSFFRFKANICQNKFTVLRNVIFFLLVIETDLDLDLGLLCLWASIVCPIFTVVIIGLGYYVLRQELLSRMSGSRKLRKRGLNIRESIYAIVTSGGNPVIASMGIVVDNSNTRRFVFDDRKEIYYRAEVQNRVYKRELVELEQQAGRLERLLEIPLQPYPRLTEELLYLLPETKVDGTPRCHKRYKRELERCNSISDGGEGVTFDISENDDILMEMAFNSKHVPKPSNKKRHSSADTTNSSAKVLQRLTRSLSIGGGSSDGGGAGDSGCYGVGKGRRRKKGRPATKSSLPFSVSDTKFTASDSKYTGNDKSSRKDGVNKLRVVQEKPNRYSDDLTYLYSDAGFDLGTSMQDVRRYSSVSMMNKDTQTNGAGKVNSNRTGKFRGDSESSYEGDDEENLFGKTSRRFFYPHLLNSKPGKIFAVKHLQIESADDDSNSTSNDNDSLDDPRFLGYLSKSSDGIFSFDGAHNQNSDGLRSERLYSDSVHRPKRKKGKSSSHSPQRSSWCDKDSWYEKKMLTVPGSVSSSSGSNFQTFLTPETFFTRPRSASTPNAPAATSPLHQQRRSDTKPQQLFHHHPPPPPPSLSSPRRPSSADLTPTATTTTSELFQHPSIHSALHPSCLNQQPFVHSQNPQVPDVNIKDIDNSSSLPPTFILSPHEQTFPFQGDNSLHSFKGSNQPSQYIPLTPISRQVSSPVSPSPSNDTVTLLSFQTSLPQNHIASELFSTRPTHLPITEGISNPGQIHPSERKPPEISLTYAPTDSKTPTPGANQIHSQQSSPSNTGMAGPLSTNGSSGKLKNTQKVVEIERRKRIQRLQDDLVRIQRELQDLNDLEYDVSEV